MAGLLEIIKHDSWFSPKARRFLADLIARGEICDIDVSDERAEEILLETKRGEERKELKPGEEPVAQFYVAEDDEVIAAYEYCTLHGIWKG